MTSEQVKTMVLLGYRTVFDEKGGFGGGSHKHRQKINLTVWGLPQKYKKWSFFIYLKNLDATKKAPTFK